MKDWEKETWITEKKLSGACGRPSCLSRRHSSGSAAATWTPSTGNTGTRRAFAKVLQPGRLYEVGYPKCVCPEVLRGETADAAHCECSRQSVLYILEQLLPEKRITVQTVQTVLGGGTCCRFAVTVE